MSRTVAPDPFWDGQTGGGVRCSSVGTDASRYHDPSEHQFEGNGGRSIGSLLPSGSRGLRGVIIPRATALGGSRGFDPNKPRLVNIDPDIKGQACVVDLSQITKESMDAAFAKASENPLAQDDIRLLAAQTFHNLAVGFEPVGMGPSKGPRLNDRLPPLGGFGTYVVPRSGLGGRQLSEPLVELNPEPMEAPISPSITPRGNVAASKVAIKRAQDDAAKRLITYDEDVAIEPELEPMEEMEQVEEVPMPVAPARPAFKDQSTAPVKQKPVTGSLRAPVLPPPAATIIGAPGTNVVFETEGWGSFEASYHEVIKSDQALVLVYDKRFKGGMKFFPPVTDKLMAAKIDGVDRVYFVHSCGTKFEHGGYEYCILPIEQDVEVNDE
jgi:hypothetical protein